MIRPGELQTPEQELELATRLSEKPDQGGGMYPEDVDTEDVGRAKPPSPKKRLSPRRVRREEARRSRSNG